MFLTSVIATFLLGLNFHGVMTSAKQSVCNGTIAQATITCQVGNYLGEDNKLSITYTGSDELGNYYSTNIFYFYIHTNNLNEANLCYGYNSTNNNVAVTGYFYSDIFGRKDFNTFVEYISNFGDYEIDVADEWYEYSPSSTDEIDIELYFTLLGETEFNNIATNQDVYNTGYNDGYGVGKQDGYNSGKNDGYTLGKDDGIEIGNDAGYRSGYSAGYYAGQVASGNPSFIGLFTSIADTPILMLRSLFNFDLFGVPILTAVLTFLTATMLIWVVKKVVK